MEVRIINQTIEDLRHNEHVELGIPLTEIKSGSDISKISINLRRRALNQLSSHIFISHIPPKPHESVRLFIRRKKEGEKKR